MQLQFYKYQSTGNDFILIDNRQGIFPKDDHMTIERLCNRRFGVGADGLILIEESQQALFSMVYFNADGGLGSFCGNGSRAAVSFAHLLGVIPKTGKFEAYDGIHEAEVLKEGIRVKMSDVQNGRETLDGIFIDTGSPHYVEFGDNVDNADVAEKGKSLRHNDVFKPTGTNVNFVERTGLNSIKVRTYERGVEAETLSCGTGVTASALLSSEKNSDLIYISTLGGDLEVKFDRNANGFTNIWLEGPTEQVYQGTIDI